MAPAAIALALLAPAPSAPFPTAPTPEPSVTEPVTVGSGEAPVNRLDAQELAEALPGIGESYAARIVAYRWLFGPIRDPETLLEIGIPAATVARIAPLLAFDP